MATRLSQWNKAAPALVEQRTATRYHVRVAIDAVGDGVVHQGTLHDVSTYGCRLAIDAAIGVGERLTITLGAAAPIEAHAIWAEDDMVGCRFAAPLPRPLSRALTLGIHPVD